MSSTSPLKPADLRKVRRYSIRQRANKTSIDAFGRPVDRSASIDDFLSALPNFLKASDFREFINLVVKARKAHKPFHVMLGAHTIKVGLSPVFIDLMRREIATGLSFNGAGLIHDLELAFFGGTSEDVLVGLQDGSFGMAQETGDLYAEACDIAESRQIGLGEAGGILINERRAKNRHLSVFGVAQELGLPMTVHVGIGTDIINQHPVYDAGKAASASYRDFRLLCTLCSLIDRGGVVANIGSAVILPEVFLKALTVARNLHRGKSRLTTANFDMIEHYRPAVNVVTRPTAQAGRGFNFIGHHELMVPLLAWGLKARLAP